MDKVKEFEPIFHPNSMAVVGVSADEDKPGNRFLRAMIEFGFKGKLYPVNPEQSEILGRKTYSSIREIPEPVDFAYISTPASSVPRIIEDCVAKGVRAVEIFTAGFSEVGEEGHRLEQEIVALAKGNLRIIGPNCFGIYCPHGGLTLMPGPKYPKESGNIALISQSGGLATHFIWAASGYGLRFSKVISYGNACDLNESDFLEYLAYDPETKTIAAYVEGVKDGKRFFDLAKGLLGRKPLIIWKSGLTETGKRAVNSHTGSMGGEKAVWQAFSRQTGTVLVDNFEEFLDTTAIFPHFSEGVGRRVAVVGGGGSVGVAASDACEQVGLEIPTSPPDIQQQLRVLLPPAGTSIRNPVDIGAPTLPPSVLQKVLEILLSWDGIDTLIIDRIFLYGTPQLVGMPGADSEKRAEVLVDIRKRVKKPLLAILGELATNVDKIDMETDRRRVQDRFLQAGIAVSPSLQRAVKALSNVCSYYEKACTCK
jgi:acyl-CoA synthetase (NDP forming)